MADPRRVQVPLHGLRGRGLPLGNHPHGGDYHRVAGDAHFHPPPDASADPDEVEESCIVQSAERLVARAVCKLWRVAYRAESYAPPNAGGNPP